MPRYPAHQSLKNIQGLTLVEAMIGLALVLMLTGVLGGLLKAGIKSSTYTLRETTMLSNARKAMEAGSSKPGMLAQARPAVSASGVLATQLALNSVNGSTPTYTLSNQILSLTQSSTALPLAKDITGLQISYYGIDGSGLIKVSTATTDTKMITTWMQTQQTGRKTYTFFSGARLRNKS